MRSCSRASRASAGRSTRSSRTRSKRSPGVPRLHDPYPSGAQHKPQKGAGVLMGCDDQHRRSRGAGRKFPWHHAHHASPPASATLMATPTHVFVDDRPWTKYPRWIYTPSHVNTSRSAVNRLPRVTCPPTHRQSNLKPTPMMSDPPRIIVQYHGAFERVVRKPRYWGGADAARVLADRWHHPPYSMTLPRNARQAPRNTSSGIDRFAGPMFHSK